MTARKTDQGLDRLLLCNWEQHLAGSHDIVTPGYVSHSKGYLMNLVIVLIVLLLLFGGGGFYMGGPMVGGSLGGLILLVLIVMLLTGKLGGRA